MRITLIIHSIFIGDHSSFNAQEREMYADAITNLSEEEKEAQTLQWISDLDANDSYEHVGVVDRMKLAIRQLTNLVCVVFLDHIIS